LLYVLEIQRNANLEKARKDWTQSASCDICSKNFTNQLTFGQHLKSKKHKRKVKEEKYKADIENMGQEIPKNVSMGKKKIGKRMQASATDLKVCLFSNKEYSSFEE
jgi:hypothetical protein